MLVTRFTDEQVEQLAYERFYHPHPRVQKKMEAVFLKAKGLPQCEICDLVGICNNTLRTYLQEFRDGGVERLKQWTSGGTSSQLDEHTDAICDHLVANPPHTIAEAAMAIERLTGVRRGPTQVREFLKRVGFSRRKTGSLPAKADPEAQAEFKKKCLSLV